MAIRNIVFDGDPILKKVSREVLRFDEKLSMLIDDMFETMYKKDGVGLAAVQVGVLRRVAVIDVGEGPIELVNPAITSENGIQKEKEGCLSLPEKYGRTSRPMSVEVTAQDRNGEWHTFKGEKLLARCFCHEIDHLDGILFTSRLAK